MTGRGPGFPWLIPTACLIAAHDLEPELEAKRRARPAQRPALSRPAKLQAPPVAVANPSVPLYVAAERARVRYGYRRLHILLRREGWEVNHKRTYRIYRDEGLSIRPKPPRRKRAWRYRQGRLAIGGPNDVWAMDFMSDRLFDGRPFRILTVVDCHTRKSALADTES